MTMPVVSPAENDSKPRQRFLPPIRPSAALELYSLTFGFHRGYERHGLSAPGRASRRSRELARRVVDFWPDRTEGLGELLVVADRLGILLGADLDPLLSVPPSRVFASEGARLDSESPEDRAALLARLDRLRVQTGLRRRWVALLNDLWREIRLTWEQEGVRRAEALAERLRERQAAVSDSVELLRGQIGCRTFDDDLRRAEEAGRLALVPSAVSATGCVLLFDLPSTCLMGFSIEPQNDVQDLRHEAEKLANRVKALSDPTRLAMLSHLTARPATVTDLAEAFGVAQPTVSAHFRVLREADLVRGVRQRGRTFYAVDGDRVRRLLAELSTAVLPPSEESEDRQV
jgi:DNA-binding transcriptional ArsR family regulator